jgi:hypothetical protein
LIADCQLAIADWRVPIHFVSAGHSVWEQLG